MEQSAKDYNTAPALLGKKKQPGLEREDVAPLISSRLQREPVFFAHDPDAGFRQANTLKPDLLPRRGDVDVLLQVLECRPSAEEQDRMAKSDAGSLRIDVQQGQPLPNLEEPLAWSAIAALLP